MEVFLPVQLEGLLFTYQRISFVTTSVLSVLSMICLLKKTPRSQAGIRTYLLTIQVLVTISSVYLDVLFTPIPAFPAIAGYCVGPLCSIFRPHSVLAVFIVLVALSMAAIMACSFYRHQTIIPANNPLRVSKKTRIMIQIALPVFMGVPPIAYGAYPFEKEDIVGQMKESPFNLSWILERGPFHIQRRSTGVLAVIYFIETDLVIFTIAVIFLFWHMFHVLKTAMNRSTASIRRQKHSLIVLFVQIAVPLIMIIVPAFILFTSLACQCIPFRVTLPAYCVLIFHPLAHNLILLSVTPAYRRFILKHIFRVKLKTQVSWVHHSSTMRRNS